MINELLRVATSRARILLSCQVEYILVRYDPNCGQLHQLKKKKNESLGFFVFFCQTRRIR
jgi:hypothetical protein